MVDFIKKNAWALKLLFILAVLLALILSFDALISNDFLKDIVADYGYLGVAAGAFFTGIAGFPVPIITFTPVFVELGLSVVFIIIAVVVGLTLGDLVTYVFGVAGRRLSRGSESKLFMRIEAYAEKYKTLPLWILLFWASFVPIPNEVLLLPMGLLGYRLAHILPPLILGNVILNTLVANGLVGIFEVIF